MSDKKTSLWIKTNTGAWSSFDWKLLREWLALKWLPPEIEVAEEKDGPWQQAKSIPKLWSETQAITKEVEFFEAASLASEKVPLSSALRDRLLELGWPGNVELLRNYYWGNKLREKLESLFPNASRVPFDDPDWPKCWSWPSPAGAIRQQTARLNEPISLKQNEVLVFFLGASHGITTKGGASRKIDELLSNASNVARWEDYNSKIPATEKQRERLKWWAEKLGRQLPSPLSKARAHELIDQWLEEHPELEDEWYEQKEQAEIFEMEISVIVDDVDEWREFYNCKKVSGKRVRDVLKITGSRAANESIEKFMDRFFSELHRQEPALFTGQRRKSHPHNSKPKGCLVLCIAWLLFFGVIGAIAAYLFSK